MFPHFQSRDEMSLYLSIYPLQQTHEVGPVITHFTDRETKAQKDEETCQRCDNHWVVESELIPGPVPFPHQIGSTGRT